MMTTINTDADSVSQDQTPKKGLGKVYFLKHKEQIKTSLQEGFTAKMIWHDLHQRGEMPIFYNQFLFYCQRYIEGYGRKTPVATFDSPPPSAPEGRDATLLSNPIAPAQAAPSSSGPRSLPPADPAAAFRNWTGRVDNPEQFKAANP